MADRSTQVFPSIDISAFTIGGNREERQSTANELAHLASLHGCVAICGHGISQNDLDQAFAVMKEVFDMPHEDKQKASRPDGSLLNRGYFGVGEENAARATKLVTDDEADKKRLESIVDMNEFFQIGSENNPDRQNIWFPEDRLPKFRSFETKLFLQANTASLHIAEALMMGLQLPRDANEAWRKFHSERNSEMRLSHYPPISAEQLKSTEVYRMSAHTDFGLLSLFFQADQGGLEFEHRNTGEWMPATPKPGYLYLAIGDIFERFSNGRFPSSKHRVVPPKSRTGHESIPSRYSISFYVAAEDDANLVPHSSLLTVDGKSKYDPLTFAELYEKGIAAVRADDSASGIQVK